MKVRTYAVALRWVVFFTAVSSGLSAANRAIAAGGGTISGTFFAETSMPGGMPAYPGAMQAGLPARTGNGLCEQAVANASSGQHLPAGLLSAIAVVESGRSDPQTGSLKPWPWTIDANGTGYVYDSAQSAIKAAAAFEAAGITSLDVGCLQVNLAQHPDAFQSLAQAFDPAANASYAAVFLTGLEQKFGNWPQAVAAYHSQTPALGEPYAAKVYTAWQNKAPEAEPMMVAAIASHGVSPQPMASAMPPAFDPTSLTPPMATLARPGRAPAYRGLASYRAAPIAIATRVVPQG